MADKTGSDDLLSILETLCLEHRAMRNEEATPQRWRKDVLGQVNAPVPRADTAKTFDELRASLLSATDDGDPNRRLIAVLQQYLVLPYLETSP